MKKRSMGSVALVMAAVAMQGGLMAMAQEAGGAFPELNLRSKATLPGSLAAAATSGGHAQLVALLRYASEVLAEQKSQDSTDWSQVARDQGIIKDLEGLKATEARILKVIDDVKDADDKKAAGDDVWPDLAGAFAWAGDMETAKKYAAKVDRDADPEIVARMRAEMNDMPGVDAALKKMEAGDRDFAYGSIAEDIWIGDPAMGEALLKKIKNDDGTQDDFVAVHYASARQIPQALAIAKKADVPFYWKKISDAYEEDQNFASAKEAKASYLKAIAKQSDAEQKSKMAITFDYQMLLEKPEVAQATAQKMSKYALAMMETSDDKWPITAGNAAAAAARLGDEAAVATLIAAADKMPDNKHQHTAVAEGAKAGRAMRLFETGKTDEAIELADTSDRTGGWPSWKVKEDLYRTAMEHGDVALAMKVESGAGTIRMNHWLTRELVKMQLEGKPLQGKPVDVFAIIAAKKQALDRGEAARAVAEELMRRGEK